MTRLEIEKQEHPRRWCVVAQLDSGERVTAVAFLLTKKAALEARSRLAGPPANPPIRWEMRTHVYPAVATLTERTERRFVDERSRELVLAEQRRALDDFTARYVKV